MGVPASAQNINTLPQWDGALFVHSWGIPNTATYGQTITPTAGQTRLGSFTFELNPSGSATPPQYQAFVYQWDSVTRRIVGSPLFTSTVLTAPSAAGFTPVTINTGSVTLSPGQQYVLFLTTSSVAQGGSSNYGFGAVSNSAYPAGQFAFQNNGASFGRLSTNPWTVTSAIDLAFMASFNPFLGQALPPGAPINPTNVAGGIDTALAAGLALSAGFNSLFLLPPAQLVDALGALAGENNTQAQQGAFQLGNSYLSLLTDPFSTNRVGATGPLGYAAESRNHSPAVAALNAMTTKAPPLASYAPHWDVWGAAFGGANATRGEPTTVGSHDADTRAAGIAAGADYRFAPNSLVGFSLAGGNVNWTVSGNGFGGNGGGGGDAFMVGVYGKHSNGPAYITGAVTYSNYWMKTDRTVTVAGLDQLHADFNAESWGGRLEGGYRLPAQLWMMQWTPYAAIQGQSFRTPNYGEVALIGSNQFALNFAERTATAFRGELGLRADKVMAIDSGSLLNLFGKLAYAHDEISNPALAANFTALGLGAAPFIVFGARPSRELALVTTGAEWKLASGVSFLAKFDGEFGDRSETYSGTGRIRYSW